MTATESYQAGRLQEAIDAQIQEVKTHPTDHGKRLFLFELLAFAGDWDRARRQIDAVKYDDPDLDFATQAYRSLLDAEAARARLMRDGAAPQFLSEPPEHARLRLEAAQLIREKQQDEAARVIARAEEAAPPVHGRLNDRPFAALRDCDDLFGTVLEVFARGAYFWVPLEQIDTLVMKAPRFPRDVLWAPARLEAAGSAGDVFLPALYPGSAQHQDPEIRLGRKTDWHTDAGPVLGTGLRTFLIDEDAVPILEWRRLEAVRDAAPTS